VLDDVTVHSCPPCRPADHDQLTTDRRRQIAYTDHITLDRVGAAAGQCKMDDEHKMRKSDDLCD